MEIIGFFDHVTSQGLWGWAVQRGNPEPLEIHVFVNGQLFATTLASNYRADIYEKGIHETGKCGFSIRFESYANTLSGEISVSVYAMVGGHKKELSHSPRHHTIKSPAVVMEMAEDGFPVPPAQLRRKVIGTEDISKYLKPLKKRYAHALSGRLEALQSPGIRDMHQILDFGCGSGRLLRTFHNETEAQLWGCDIDGDAISWAQKNLPFATFIHNGEYPPLPFEDHSFDLIFAVSVFTHLDEVHQHAWLEELKRITQKGGVVYLTFKDESYIQQYEVPEKRDLLLENIVTHNGLFFRKTSFWKGDFPDYYQSTYHTRDYIEETWSKYFRIIKIIEPGELQFQAVAVMVRD